MFVHGFAGNGADGLEARMQTPGSERKLKGSADAVTAQEFAERLAQSLQPFAGRGGESVAVGPDGRVYVANGQIFVYAPDGRPEGRLDVPERPLQLVFGEEGGRTLFILTHHSLYACAT